DWPVPVRDGEKMALGMKSPAGNAALLESQSRLVATHIPELESPGGRAEYSQNPAAAEAGVRRLAQFRQGGDLRIVGDAADRAAPLVGRADIELKVVAQVHPDASRRKAAEFLGDVQIRQGQGGDGLVAQRVEPPGGLAQLVANGRRLAQRG